jgi:hypothetical protein
VADIANSNADAHSRVDNPRLRGMHGRPNAPTDKGMRTVKYCAYDKVTKHFTEDCAVVHRPKAEANTGRNLFSVNVQYGQFCAV